MAKQLAAAEIKPSVVTRTTTFFQEVKAEMVKVTWPSTDELKTSTSVVLLLLAISAGITYVIDIVLQVVVMGLFKLV